MVNVNAYIRHFEALAQERTSFETLWQDVSDYIIPRRGRYSGAIYSGVTGGQAGQRVGDKMLDTTAGWACGVFASGLEALLTSQLTPWFRLTLADPELAQRPGVAQWLETVTRRMQATFANPASGFYSNIRQCYLDLGTIGTCAMFSPETLEAPGILYQSRHMSECFIEEDAQGRVVSMYRHFRWTAEKAVEFFTKAGDQVPDQIRKAAAKPDDRRRFRFLHITVPRGRTYGNVRFARNMPWMSLWIALDQKAQVRVGGYLEFPYQVCRWEKMTEEDYGRSPGDFVMKTVKLANAQKKTVQEAGVLRVRPPVQIPDDGVLGTPRMGPGGINYLKTTMGQGRGGEIKKIDLAGDPGIGVDMMKIEQEAIERAYLTDVMTLPFLDRMTATEIAERRHLRLLQIAPQMSRPTTELIGPVIRRTFAVKYRRGDFGQAPRELLDGRDGGELEIEWTNPVAIAQRVAEAMEPTDRVLNVVDRVVAHDPGAGVVVHGERIIRRAHAAHGAPQDMLRSEDEVAAIRERESADAADAQQLDALTQGASASKDLAQAANLVRDAA